MYQPNQIRNLPLLSDEEKSKYEHGLRSLWTRANNSAANSPEQIAARQKIIEFSKMLYSKIQTRRNQAQQQQGQQAGQAGARPMAGQQNPAGQAQPPQQTAAGGAGSPVQTAANAGQTPQGSAAAAAAAAQRNKIPDTFLQHAAKVTFRPPPQLSGRTPTEIAKWVDDMKEKYARALFTIEQSKSKVTGMEKIFKERAAAGKPLQDEELKQYTLRREQQLKAYSEATKWMESVKKQQESLQGNNQGADGSPVAGGSAGNRNQNGVQNVAANATVDATKNQQQQAAANRASPANGTSTPTGQAQHRVGQPVTQQTQVKTEQPQPPALNTAQASAQAQAAGRVQTPQSATAAAAAGQTRALSHSAAMSLANQKAAGVPSGAAGQPQQPGAAVPGAGGAMNQSAVGSGNLQQQQQQQGHPHAHPTQQQTGFQAKMPIPKQLPERATAVPQGVTVGGGVSAGRPTMSQGSGTLGGVMNQPAVPRVAAYSHDAEGDHVLSKKKLDELVRQVCGGSADSQEGNLLTPEVEEVRVPHLWNS